MGSPPSFAGCFRERAAREPGLVALHTVRTAARALVTTPHSHADLLRGASHIASRLESVGVAEGDRVLLSISDAAVFLSAFLAVQGLRCVPVPVPAFRELPRVAYLERVCVVAADSEAAAVLSDAPVPDGASRLSWIVLDAPDGLGGSFPEPPGDRFDLRHVPEIAFLQYTSGSTGTPKGVVVTQSNLLSNLSAISAGASIGADDRVLSWLPLFHDMGLVAGLLLGVHLGLPTYVARPSLFSSRPETWLRAISELRATFSPGPNFAFDALARRHVARVEGIDLSGWRLAFDGAEAVRRETVRAFCERFRSVGFASGSLRPAYGLAEATLAVAFPREVREPYFDHVLRSALVTRGVAIPAPEGAADAVDVASVGTAVPEHDIHIRAPGSDRDLPERQLGEIVVVGPSVTPGYYRELRAGAESRAELWTGDLGYLAGGELFVVDRLKDILVLSGRNYSPGDIERVLGTVPGVRPEGVIAFSAPAAHGTDELLLMVAAAPRAALDLVATLRRATHDHFGLTPRDVFLVRPSELPRTTSGKPRRSECRTLFESGKLERMRASSS